MENKNHEANELLKNYNNAKEELGELPQSMIIDSIDNFNAELSEKLRTIYQGHYFFSNEYGEEDSGKPLYQTMEEIKNHPLMKMKIRELLDAAIQNAIKESKNTEKK
jgi:hypothetical protein